MNDSIVVKGARAHNLKNIDITLPRDKLIVITGLSGSGKSSLAFDTIYAEGQRRYVESLSSYARQFLGMMDKPDVDSIDGLSPAISIEQKTTSKNPRSTVGTVTEIYDYLRLLFARVGTPFCPEHNVPIEKKSPQKVAESISQEHSGDLIILAPLVSQKKGTYEKLAKDLHKEGYSRLRLNGTIQRTDEKLNLDRYKKHDIDVVIDRLNSSDTTRLTEAIERALMKGKGKVIVQPVDSQKKSKSKSGTSDLPKDKLYSALYACPHCDLSFEELQPRMFSFNSPFGACEECSGLGIKQEIDAQLVVPDTTLSLADGCIAAYRNAVDGWRGHQLAAVAKNYGFDVLTPFSKLSKKQKNTILYGSDRQINFVYRSKSGDSSYQYNGDWEGVIPQLDRLYQQTESDYRKREIEKYMRVLPCQVCEGRRLKNKVLAVKINDRSIIEVTDFSITDAIDYFRNLTLTKNQMKIGAQVLKEINNRLEFLNNVGLSYLNLSRTASTLSGGEAQRIRLATQIGSNLTGVLYVLDEPSIGLHQRDNEKLIKTLTRLRDLGNTLLVVEHDEDTMRSADYLVDLGPGAGVHGGNVIAAGTPKQVEKNKNSITGKYLSGKESITLPKKRRKPTGKISIVGAEEHNLKNISVDIPTGVYTAITGVSGSGKSTLVHDILYRSLMQQFYKSRELPGKHKKVKVPKDLRKVVMIDQSPIGKTPRSNPATYIKVFDDIRSLFAKTKESLARGYKPGRYSFNVAGGRCEACRGDGLIKIEMNFLPDVYVTCDECKGTRYNAETLEVTYKDKNISQVLGMSVEESLSFFENIPKIRRKLQTLFDVGLGYITLGQSSTTLSGGESQRIKLTKELSRRSTGDTIYLLDEPTTGLHIHDVKKLLSVLNRLVDKGNSILCIEHNLDMIKCADHVIDLGPEGGDGGGTIVATGTPEAIAKNKNSHTGEFLARML